MNGKTSVLTFYPKVRGKAGEERRQGKGRKEKKNTKKEAANVGGSALGVYCDLLT